MGEGGRISWGRLLLGGMFALAIFALLAVLVGPLVAVSLGGGSHYQIRSNAMAPALLVGDWVLAETIHPGDRPARGDIVVYEDPAKRGEERIRRVIALPGERVHMRGGALYIDGQRAGMERLGEQVIAKRPPGRGAGVPRCLDDPVPLGAECRREIWRETLPDGSSRRVLNSRGKIGVFRPSAGKSGNDTTPITVPDGHVFVIGDNRDEGVDSRFQRHGTVPLENIRYRVWMIHTSLERTSRLPWPRWERFFRLVE